MTTRTLSLIGAGVGIVVVALGVGLLARSRGRPAAFRITHPTSDNIPSGRRVHRIPVTSTPNPRDTLRLEWQRRISGARETLRIGELGGSSADVFGLIGDVAVQDNGDILVLDSRLNVIRAFSPAGAPEWSFGRPGHGPNEFPSPEAIELIDDSTMVFLDQQRLLRSYGLRDDGLVWKSEMHIDVAPEGLCHIADTVFVQGSHRERGVVHKIVLPDRLVLRIGELYRSANPIAVNQLSDGPVGCSAGAGTVLFARKYFPYLYGFRSDGGAGWVGSLDEFQPMVITETADGGIGFDLASTPSFNTVAAIRALGPDYFLVQAAKHTVAGLTAHRLNEGFHSYVVNAATGEGLYVGDDLPLVHDVRLPFVYGAVEEPHPQVVVLRLALDGQ